MAVVGTLAFASLQRTAQSQSTSPAFTAGANLPSFRLAGSVRRAHIWFTSKGKRGNFTIELRSESSGTPPFQYTRSWWLRGFDTPAQLAPTGQYGQITGGGRRSRGSGYRAAWHIRLVGVVSRPGAARQRVLITLKGRPDGVFVLTPLEPGVLKRDSGTQDSFETG